MSQLRFLGGVGLVALAVLLGTTGPVSAQHHFGGFHHGGSYPGGYYGGFHHQGYYPGYWGGGYGGGYYPRYGGYSGYYYPGYYGYSYPSYSYPSYSYPSYPYVYVDPGVYYRSNVATGSPAPVTTTQSLYYSPPSNGTVAPVSYTEPTNNSVARMHVRVPADATLWIDGKQTSQIGPERDFVTPGLTPGRTYSYQMRARWMDNRQPVERTVKVEIRANETTQVDFMAPSRG